MCLRKAEHSKTLKRRQEKPDDALIRNLEAEDLVLELADRASLSESERLGGLLHGADHGRRAAEHNLDVASRGRETLLLHNQTLATDPNGNV